MTKQEERYREFCHDLAEITREYVRKHDLNEYPKFNPGFRGYVARALQEKGYFQVTIKLGDIARLK